MHIDQEVIDCIKNARRVCILTGAGVSAESGIATFRDAQEGKGLWSQYDPQQLASIDGFLKDPQTIWQWYQWRRDVNKDKVPNPAHLAIARWQKESHQNGNQVVSLITQNVDGLHQKAGSDPVTELHGNIWRNHCLQCGQTHQESVEGIENVPQCLQCGGQVRPSVVWFGEALPDKAWREAESTAYSCDLFLSVGTSSQVYPAAGLAALAKSQGATVIEINPEPTNSSVVDYQIEGKAGEVMSNITKVESK